MMQNFSYDRHCSRVPDLAFLPIIHTSCQEDVPRLIQPKIYKCTTLGFMLATRPLAVVVYFRWALQLCAPQTPWRSLAQKIACACTWTRSVRIPFLLCNSSARVLQSLKACTEQYSKSQYCTPQYFEALIYSLSPSNKIFFTMHRDCLSIRLARRFSSSAASPFTLIWKALTCPGTSSCKRTKYLAPLSAAHLKSRHRCVSRSRSSSHMNLWRYGSALHCSLGTGNSHPAESADVCPYPTQHPCLSFTWLHDGQFWQALHDRWLIHGRPPMQKGPVAARLSWNQHRTFRPSACQQLRYPSASWKHHYP